MSFVVGDAGEKAWASHLQSVGYSDIETSKGLFYDWDIRASKDGESSTFEVKYDRKAYMWMKWRKAECPNLYIEYKNTSRGLDSGILASKADFYVYIIEQPSGPNSVLAAHIFRTDTLREFLINGKFKSTGNKANGDDNAMGWLLPLDVATSNKASGWICKKYI